MIIYRSRDRKIRSLFFRSFRLETVRLRQFVVDHKFIIFIPGHSAAHEEIDLLGMEMMLHQYHYDNGRQMYNKDKQ